MLPSEAKIAIVFLYLAAIFFFLLGIYLNEVISQEFGVRKNLLFCLKRKKTYRKLSAGQDQPFNESIVINNDIDVQIEKKLIEGLDDQQITDFPLVIKNITKKYPQKNGRQAHLALIDFSLGIRQGEIFGLLGPNGAGKTTLISILTGVIPSDDGNAWLNGFDIQNELTQV